MRLEIVVDKTPSLAEILADRVLEAAGQAIGSRGRFSIALAGGSLATTFFPRLARLPLSWARTEFFWADERAVAPSDLESNYGRARALWLDPARVPAACIHPMAAG